MSDYQDKTPPSSKSSVQSKLHICIFSPQPQFAQSLIKLLNCDRYEVTDFSLIKDSVDFLTDNNGEIDCLILVKNTQTGSILRQLSKLLWQSRVLLPTAIIEMEHPPSIAAEMLEDFSNSLVDKTKTNTIYHRAEIQLYFTQLAEINSYIDLAITKFLGLAPSSDISDISNPNNCETLERPELEVKLRNSLIFQQRRLTEKIKERLGYLKFYYPRQASNFYHNLSPKKQAQFYQELSQTYRGVLLKYFDENSKVNKLIDEFVDQAFFADISTSQILEMHMQLIDDFSYQLKIEGRSDDILLDYRLPLIDIISHLCELYRRSAPGKDVADLSLDLMFSVE